jgi:hypothetical protein
MLKNRVIKHEDDKKISLEDKLNVKDKTQISNENWAKTKRICKGCLQVVTNKSRYYHQRSKKHKKLTEELSKTHLPLELRAKRQQLKLLYDL